MKVRSFSASLCFATVVLSFNTLANSAEEFLNTLKSHYQNTSSINAFSLTHSYLGRSDPFQSWDYKAPTRYQAFKVTEIDLMNKHYYQNVVHHFTGGLYFDEVHFQNSNESLRYERNGISLGKKAIPQKLSSFNRYTNLTLMNLDFLAVRPLIDEQNVIENIQYQKNSTTEKVTLIHRPNEKTIIEYVFDTEPLRLTVINNKTRNRIFEYSDYRTNNGLNFAHSLIKKYNGDTVPSFITRIERFEVIEKIDPEKLNLPQGYIKTPAVKSIDKDKTLFVSNIASNLFLVTDRSETNNILFQVNSDEITVFGVPRGKKAAQEVINTIKSKFPAKRFRAIHVTHPYSDHIAGLVPFVEQGAVVLADAYTIEAIKAFPLFSDSIESFVFEAISNKQVINGVRFFVLENARSKRQSFAYFEDIGVIYQTDFLEVANDNTIANLVPSYTKHFIQFIKDEKLSFDRIIGFHRNNNISPAVVDKTYQADTL